MILKSTLCFLLALLVACSDSNEEITSANDNEIANEESCASCHQQQVNEWHSSHHFKAMDKATQETVLGDFNNVSFTSKNILYKFTTQNNKYFVEITYENQKTTKFEVSYVFGFTPLQQYLIEFDKGKIQCLTIAWDDQKKQWYDLYPKLYTNNKDRLHWTNQGANWNSMCASCHTTFYEKNFNEEKNSYNSNYKSMNVACQSCHGVATSHLEWAKNPKSDLPFKGFEKSLKKINTLNDNSIEINSCAPCHSRRSELNDKYQHTGDFLNHFMPNWIINPLYENDGKILDEVYVYGSFLQSKMFHHHVRCSDCHNPHSNKLKFQGNQLCLQCHSVNKDNIAYDSINHHHHKDSKATLCISCHMPEKTYMGIDNRRDHSFRVPRPDLSEQYNVSNACNDCHQDKSFTWAKDSIIKWHGKIRQKHFSEDLLKYRTAPTPDIGLNYQQTLIKDESYPAIIRASALQELSLYSNLLSPEERNSLINFITPYLQHKNDLIRLGATQAMVLETSYKNTVKLLNKSLNDSLKAIRIAACLNLHFIDKKLFSPKQLKSLEKAEKELLVYFAHNSDFASGQYNKGLYFNNKNNFQEAIKCYKKAISLDRYFFQSYHNLANIYRKQEKYPQAKEVYQKMLELRPNDILSLQEILVMSSALKNFDDTIKYSQQLFALLNPRQINPTLFYFYAQAYKEKNQYQKAEEIFLHLIKNHNQINSYYYLASFYIETKNSKAKTFIELCLNKFKNNPSFVKLYQQLEN